MTTYIADKAGYGFTAVAGFSCVDAIQGDVSPWVTSVWLFLAGVSFVVGAIFADD